MAYRSTCSPRQGSSVHRTASGAIVLSSVYWPGAAVHLEACPDCREDYVGLRDLVLAEAKWPANPG